VRGENLQGVIETGTGDKIKSLQAYETSGSGLGIPASTTLDSLLGDFLKGTA
jgi:hypothetical protein